MLPIRVARQIKFQRIRQFHSTLIKNEKKSVLEPSIISQASKPVPETISDSVIGSPLHNVTKIDRWILVWVKRYPSKDQVPSRVPIECIQRAHTLVRVRICFIMMGFTIVAFILSAMSGKREVAGGKNLYTETEKYYKRLKEKKRMEAEKNPAVEAKDNV